jgi:hypothetical protein
MVRRNRLALMAGAAVTLLVVGCSGAPKTAASGPDRLANCAGAPAARPEIVVVKCFDDSMVARQLKWSGWGSRVATATGSATLNMCEFIPQDCASGDYQAYPVVLIASGAVRCRGGGRAYARIQTVLVGHDGGVWPRTAIDAITRRPCGQRAS